MDDPWAGQDPANGGSAPPPADTDAPDEDAYRDPIRLWHTIHNLTTQQDTVSTILNNVLNGLQQLAIAPPSAQPAPASMTSRSTPKFAEPHKFNSKADQVQPFLSEVDAAHLQRHVLVTDYNRILCISGYFTDGTPKTWWYGVQHSQPALLHNYATFKTELEQHFGDPDLAASALRKLRGLKQTGSCANYVARYNELFPYLNLTDETKISMFKLGLKDHVADLMVTVRPQPTSFDDYAATTIEFDNLVHQREQDKKDARPSGSSRAFTSVTSSSMSTRSTPRTPASSSSAPPAGDPMEIDAVKIRRGPLTAEEKERRRREGLCGYCGKDGHFALDCPNKSAAAKKRDAERTAPKKA
jgi:hypothetical protein